MDVDDTDLPSNAAETSLVPIETHELGDGIFVTVVDGGKDTQAQWDVVFFLQNLFTTRDEDKLRDHFVTKKRKLRKSMKNCGRITKFPHCWSQNMEQ
jgi:DUF1365 family protein